MDPVGIALRNINLDPLGQSLGLRPIPLETRRALVKAFWGDEPNRESRVWEFGRRSRKYATQSIQDYNDETWETYFTTFFNQQYLTADGAHHGGGQIAAQSFKDLLLIVKRIHDDVPKELLLDELKQSGLNGSDDEIQQAIGLTAALLVMVPVLKLSPRAIGPPLTTSWTKDPLRQHLGRFFAPPQDTRAIKPDTTLLASNFRPIAELEIHWTDDLDEHLYLNTRRKTISIFHHVTFLQCYPNAEPLRLLPTGLAEETLRTLRLLFPRSDENTALLDAEMKTNLFDKVLFDLNGLTAAERDIGHFHFWRERLGDLSLFYDEARPHGIRGLWKDRRKRDQWFNSWVGIVAIALAVFFGLVQSIEGGIQVYKAYHPSGA